MTARRLAGFMPAPHTRARLTLLMLALVLVCGIWRPLPRHGSTIPGERTDSALFAAVISRVAEGEPYYSAMGTELRARGYPAASIFNWRIPTHVVGLAKAPIVMRLVLLSIAIGVIAGTVSLFSRGAPEILILAVMMQIGATAGAFTPLAAVLPEPWAGICLAASALLYTRGHFRLGAALGLAALFFRELATLYVGVCAVLALKDRRRGELAIWVSGGIVWAVFYCLHAAAALQSMQLGDLAHPSWVQFGGFRFVLATIGFGTWFYFLPAWMAAVGGVLLLASAWARIRAPHIKAATIAYLAFFFVVGQTFNQSWGLLTAPLWAIGYGLGADGLVGLVREARGPD